MLVKLPELHGGVNPLTVTDVHHFMKKNNTAFPHGVAISQLRMQGGGYKEVGFPVKCQSGNPAIIKAEQGKQLLAAEQLCDVWFKEINAACYTIHEGCWPGDD